jgi:mRNA interferase MazF
LPNLPSRSEVWSVDLNPPGQGHEQHGVRPALVISVDKLNHSKANTCVIVPITGTDRRIPTNVPIEAPEGGLDKDSFALCEQVRSISRSRLTDYKGQVEPQTMKEVCKMVRLLLGL